MGFLAHIIKLLVFDGIINKTDVGEGTLDLPYLYTLESSKDEYNIRKTINSLERLYSTAFPEVNAELVKSTFKIAKADQLLVEIKKKMNLPLDEWNYDGVNVEVGEINYFVSILEYNYYVDYICCKYHETRYNRINVKCSKSRVIRWMVNIFDHINTYTDLNLIPGRHVATTLRDGSSLMIENAHLPLTAAELNLNRNTSYDDNILPNSIISP
uniref:Maelstrom domain-containing protein n=1 Tax=Schizaphis graminum TaxID=13262 RepID=A0A2S2NWV6_SCHGA